MCASAPSFKMSSDTAKSSRRAKLPPLGTSLNPLSIEALRKNGCTLAWQFPSGQPERQGLAAVPWAGQWCPCLPNLGSAGLLSEEFSQIKFNLPKSGEGNFMAILSKGRIQGGFEPEYRQSSSVCMRSCSPRTCSWGTGWKESKPHRFGAQGGLGS